jgi:hypothetical protein
LQKADFKNIEIGCWTKNYFFISDFNKNADPEEENA